MGEIFYKVKNISYRIDMNEDNTEALITPVIDLEAEKDLTLVACLDLDGHELIPSARLSLKKGGNKVEMKYFKIVRPPYFKESYAYKCELHISQDCREYQTHVETITLCGIRP
jgi:hypothetical protein